jgi:TolA-binding protein
VGFQYRFKKNTRINLALQENGRKDRFDEPKFNYSEKALRLGMSQNIGKFSFMVRAEIGTTDNHLARQTYDMKRYTFSSHFRPTARHDISGYMYYNNYSWFTGELIQRLTAGVRLSIWLSDKTSFYINYQNHYSPEEYYFDRNAFEFRLKHDLSDNFQVYLQGRQTLMRNSFHNRETAILFGVSIPVGIPVSRKKNIGVVKGTVYDELTNKPVKDLILHINGSTAVTDKNGKFIFPALSPQTYYLTLDKSSVGLNRVTLKKSPVEIELHENDVVDIYLYITKGSSCTGQVAVFSDIIDENIEIESSIHNNRLHGPAIMKTKFISGDGSKKNLEQYGLPNIIVEMRRDDEVLRRVTDSKGFFSFEDLRPGDWTVQFFEKNLPQYHMFKNNVYHVNLKPGDKKKALIRVLPQKRRIQMQQEEKILAINETKERFTNKTVQKDKENINPIINKIDQNVETNYKFYLGKYRQKDYRAALKGFGGLLKSHGNHNLAGNFQYWVGECYYAMEENRNALISFQAVLRNESYHKHDDALIKCGIINMKLNNRTIAKKYFNKVLNIFPYSDCVPIAKKYLNSI